MISRRSLLFLILLFVFWRALAQESTEGEIVGLARDQSTHQVLAGVNVVVVGTTIGAATDAEGRFRITGISPGTYSLRASMIGYKPVVKTDIIVAPGRKSRVVFELSEEIVQLGEVTVQADYFSRRAELATSGHNLNYEEVRRSPGAAGDVSRVVQSIPGVVMSADLRNDLIVRGGSPTENLFIVDNLEVPNVNHFGTQGASGGPIGMINTEFIREVTFISGGFPAKYGDKLSSIMEIDLREGNREEFEAKINVNAAGAGVIGEGPLGEEGSWLASVRRSYFDFLLKYFNFSGITVVPNFGDGQAKVVLDLGRQDKLSFLAIGGIDDIKFANVERKNYGANPDLSGVDDLKNHQYQYLVGGTWKRLWGNSGYSFLSLSHNLNYYFTDINDSLGNKTYHNESTEGEYTVRGDGSFTFDAQNQAAVGFGLKLVDVRHTIFLKADTSRWADRGAGTGIFPELDYDKIVRSYKLWGYAQYTRWFFNRLTVTPGLRADYFDDVDLGFTLSPRIAFRFFITQRTSINASAGIYYQTPSYLWLTTDDRNRALKPLRSDHLIVGVEHLVQDDLRIALDLYHKRYSQYPVSGYIPSFILVNGGAEPGAFLGGDLRSVGTGFARGVELFLQKKLTQDYYGTVSYSLYETRFKALDGIERRGNFDYRHVLTLIAGYKFSRSFELSAKWRYAGGRPYTPIDPERSRFYGRETLDLRRINAERYPPYHRLDVRGDYRFSLGSWDLVVYLDLQNAYNRKNIYYHLWDDTKKEIVTIHQWSLLPVFGLNAEL